MVIVKRILLPTDLSEHSLAGIEFVQSLSILCNAYVYLVHVVEDIAPLAFPSIEMTPPTLFRESDEKRMRELNFIIAERLGGMKSVIPLILHGDPVKEIVRFAEDQEMDLIVMSTHGRTGLAHIFMGSIAEKVVRYSSAPVLTVKPDEMKRDPSQQQEEENHSRKQQPLLSHER